MKIFNIVLIILFTLSIQVIAGEISGVPSITDGDTVKILDKRIRFHGIDTPEKKQMCIRNSKEYSCGEEATNALKRKIGGKPVNVSLTIRILSSRGAIPTIVSRPPCGYI